MRSPIPRALLRKRRALAYEFSQASTRQKALYREISALDYSIKLLDPNWTPPARVSRPLSPPRVANGLIARTCMRLLPLHAGISTTELTLLVADICGIPVRTAKDRVGLASAVAMALRRQQRRGLAVEVGKDPKSGVIAWRARLLNERRAERQTLQ